MNNVENKTLTQDEYNQYLELKKQYDLAKGSTVPHFIDNEGQLTVVGDASNIELEPFDVTIGYAVPSTEKHLIAEDMQVTQDEFAYFHFTKTYENVTIPAMFRIKIMGKLVHVITFFKKIMGEDMLDINENELIHALLNMESELLIATYEFVELVLGENIGLMRYAKPFDVFATAGIIFAKNPDLVKEVESFLFSGGMNSAKEQIDKLVAESK